MKQLLAAAILGSLAWQVVAAEEELLCHDFFDGKLGQGWSWVREHPETWRMRDKALEIRVEPGNMWGGANNARNVLIRPAPAPGPRALVAEVTIENRPGNQYEQVDLVWYYDDSHMVKLGQELVDGKLSVVMGREEKDRTRTIAIKPLAAAVVRVRLTVRENAIRGEFLPEGESAWQEAGACDLPAPPGGKPHFSIQCYQGAPDAEHWARLTRFRAVRLGP